MSTNDTLASSQVTLLYPHKRYPCTLNSAPFRIAAQECYSHRLWYTASTIPRSLKTISEATYLRHCIWIILLYHCKTILSIVFYEFLQQKAPNTVEALLIFNFRFKRLSSLGKIICWTQSFQFKFQRYGYFSYISHSFKENYQHIKFSFPLEHTSN